MNYHLLKFFLLRLNIVTAQINFDHTDHGEENVHSSQRDCLRLDFYDHGTGDARRILWYCLGELPAKLDIDTNDDQQDKFTFAHLVEQNITSEDLYQWSAPIDVAENYQFYRNQLAIPINDTILANRYYYNCTWPTFGPACQYEFYNEFCSCSSLKEFIFCAYKSPNSHSNGLTCYQHLQCDRGPASACLDWSEICDGKIDCRDGGHDEDYCWQLEINECEENEYRCKNGQCIVQLDATDKDGYGCLDYWNDIPFIVPDKRVCFIDDIPSILCEDSRCQHEGFISSCLVDRAELLKNAIFSERVLSVTPDCSLAFQLLFVDSGTICLLDPSYCELNQTIETVNEMCPSLMSYPNIPIFTDLVFVYFKPFSSNWFDKFIKKPLICYTKDHYNRYFSHLSKTSFQNLTCINSQYFIDRSEKTVPANLLTNLQITSYLHNVLQRYHLIYNYSSVLCNRPNLYQCVNSSKCISIYRLLDRTYDCPYLDDEQMDFDSYPKLSERWKKSYFKCQKSNKYIHHSQVKDNRRSCDCGHDENGLCEDEEEEEDQEDNDIKYYGLFQSICDRITDIFPVQNLTDETDCEEWECDNMYTHCNEIKNCPNATDELGCSSWLFPLNCSSKHLLCVSAETGKLICLPSQQISNAHMDCLGGIDEITPCLNVSKETIEQQFYCQQNSSSVCLDYTALCDGKEQCENGDDEQICASPRNDVSKGMCVPYNSGGKSIAERFLCNYHTFHYRIPTYFHINTPRIMDSVDTQKTAVVSKSLSQVSGRTTKVCHRGVNIRVSSKDPNESFAIACFCPPMYYGNRCQYQHQRISLSMKFRALSDSLQTLFAIVVLLIDNSDQRVVHSYEQFSYLSVRNCRTRYDFYLLYATRPKDPMKNYSIHVDIYEKVSFDYRGSSLFPIQFGFLPVHRLTYLVDIPRIADKTQSCVDQNCVHGKCVTYTNSPHHRTFCQCDENWSGKYCTIAHHCTCASNSRCIGLSADNRSICVCPRNQIGSRCLLNGSSCLTNGNSTCQKGGQCVPLDDVESSLQPYFCRCPKGFYGERCENVDTKLILSFGRDVAVSQSVLLHFINIPSNDAGNDLEKRRHRRATTFGTVLTRHDPLIILWSHQFTLLFLEFPEKRYYLTDIERKVDQSKNIYGTTTLSNRCPSISELFNQTFLQWHLLRRIKSYHQPCQNRVLNLSCFHDEVHFCLCYSFGEKRLANCFNFDHDLKFNCYGDNECEHDGSCFQDSKECPTRSICQCKQCSFGRRCQFVTDSFGVSLDVILAYYISSHLPVVQQSEIIKFSLSLTILFIITGLIDSFLSLITFKNASVRQVGCGIYLLCSAVNNLLTTVLFGLKFFIFLLAQMAFITNRSLLTSQCYSFDFLLRICLCMNQWLNACVAMDRTVTVIRDIYFDRRKSVQIAKRIIVSLLLIIVGTSIHDPLHRRLIDEENDEDGLTRISCVVIYSSIGLQRYNSLIHAFHFVIPFVINIVSSIILITVKSRQQTRIQRNGSYRQILRRQIQEHKHLLIAPLVLIILALPRLILALLSKCMESVDDAWIFLIPYFISFIPSMVTFVVFILPSRFYKREFHKSISEYRKLIQRCFNSQT